MQSKNGAVTKFPSRLDERDVGVVDEEGHGAAQEVGVRLEVGVEDGDEVAAADVGVLHALPQRAGLVPAPVVADLVLDVHAPRPTLALQLHQLLDRPRLILATEYLRHKDC
jgi:hypothetical protein